MKTSDRPVLLLLGLLALTVLSLPMGVSAQVPDSMGVSALAPDSVGTLLGQETERDSVPMAVGRSVTPRGAFLRSMLLPGWGHAEAGSYVRGGFYFSLQAATGFMLFKTQTRLTRARDRLDLMEAVVRRRLEASGITDIREIEDALGEDPRVEDLRALKTSRSEQRQDWIAMGIFIMFLGGADAFVSTHLADFPAAVEIGTTPSGGLQVGLSAPVGF